MKHIISLGAGVQSSTMALMAAHGEITPMPDAAIFADTQAEPDEVYSWLDWLEAQLPFPVVRVTKGNLHAEVTDVRTSKKSGKVYWRSMLPYFLSTEKGLGRLSMRKCTSDYKIEPVHRHIRGLMGKGEQVVQWMGISWDEKQRMRDSRKPFIEHRYPLIEMNLTRQGCLNWMKANDYPEPPRSACYFCPFHSNQEWSRLKKEHPRYFALAVEYEKTAQRSAAKSEILDGVPYLHSSCQPLSEIDFDASSSQYSLLDECEGMCGV